MVFGKFSHRDGKKSCIARKVALCKKNIKAQRFVVFSENDTRLPCLSVISLGYGRLLNGASWSIVPRCQELRSKPLHGWALGLPFLSIMCSHCFPIQAQFIYLFFFFMYRNLIQSYLWICSVLAACICDSALPGPVLVPWHLHWPALTELGARPGSANVNKARHPALLQHLKLFFLCCGLLKMYFTLEFRVKKRQRCSLGTECILQGWAPS